MPEFKRPFGVIVRQHERFICACGEQSNYDFQVNRDKGFDAECPACGTKFFSVSGYCAHQIADLFDGYNPRTIENVGYQAIPWPKDGFGIAINAGEKFPLRLNVGVTSKGNFHFILNYVRYDAYIPGYTKTSRDRASLLDSERQYAVGRFARMVEERGLANLSEEELMAETLDQVSSKAEKPIIWGFCMDEIMPHLARGHKISTYSYGTEKEDELKPVLQYIRGTERIEAMTYAPHRFLTAHMRGFVQGKDTINVHLRKSEFDRAFIIKDDGRIFHLNQDNELWRGLWNGNRALYKKEKARSNKFQFATGNSLFQLWRSYQAGPIFSGSVRQQIEHIYEGWLGHHVTLHGDTLQSIVETMYNQMVLIKSGTFTQRVLAIARTTGSSDMSIIKHGADGAVFGYIGKNVKRKQFRKDLTGIYQTLRDDKDARLFSAKMALAQALSGMENHGLASMLFYGMDEALKEISENNDDSFNRNDAREFTESITYFSEFMVPQKIVDITKNTLELAIGRNAPYVMSNTSHDLQDAARAARTCLDGGITLEALKQEIDRVNPDWSSIHNHLYTLANAVANEAKMARMQNFKFTDFQERLSMTVEGFDFVVEHPTNLHNVGAEMRICVGSYAESCYEGSLTIVTMRKEGTKKYHACLEINTSDGKTGRQGYEPSVRQAKLSCNMRLSEDKDAAKALRKWAKRNALAIQTYDMSEAR